MHHCNSQCIYFNITTDKSKTPNTKIVCEMQDEEIKNIPKHIKDNCKYFKTYEDIKLKHKKKFSVKYILTE